MTPDPSRTRVFGAATSVTTEEPSLFHSFFSQPPNLLANLPGNSTFTPSNAMQPTTGTDQAPRAASVPRHAQGQASLGNPPAAPNPVSIFAEEEEQLNERRAIMSEESPSPI